MDDFFFGLLIGLLCGLLPLIFGFLFKNHVIGVIGIVASALMGALFSVLHRSPFTAVGVAIIFVVILLVKNKNKQKQHETDDDDEMYMDDE